MADDFGDRRLGDEALASEFDRRDLVNRVTPLVIE